MVNKISHTINTTAYQNNKAQTQQTFTGISNSNSEHLSNAKAVNQHGDSLEVSFGSRPFVEYQPADLYPPFKLNVANVINNLLKGTDGMTAYGQNTPASWRLSPQRNSYQQAPGFKADLGLNGPQTFNKAIQDGCVDAGEKNLAANQLAYDSTYLYPQGSQESQKTAEARNFLSSVFFGPTTPMQQGQIRPEFDVNMNGKLDCDDVQVLSIQDGDIDNISNTDLNIATTNFVMNKPYQYPYFPGQN